MSSSAEWCAACADPADVEAISGLRLRPFLGTLITPHQIEQAKAEMRRWPRPPTAGGGGCPLAVGARRGNAGLPANVRAMVADAADGPEFVGLERHPVAAGRRQAAAAPYRTMLLALMPGAGREPKPARGRLVGTVLGILHEMDDIRAAAVAGLGHPLDHYAMLLLGRIQVPVEARAWVDGAAAYYTVFQEGGWPTSDSPTRSRSLRRWS